VEKLLKSAGLKSRKSLLQSQVVAIEAADREIRLVPMKRKQGGWVPVTEGNVRVAVMLPEEAGPEALAMAVDDVVARWC
jgi:hypothetical protein